jgi:DNA polymerase III delta prime subunit
MPHRLILIEGPPGVGKSTAALNIAEHLRSTGRECECWSEWDPAHPIRIGDHAGLGQVISTSIARQADVLSQWQRFADERKARPLTIIESRYWQTSLLLMYIAGATVDELREYHHRVVQAITPLNPALIHLTVTDLPDLVDRSIQARNAHWQQIGLPQTWTQYIYGALDGQPWLVSRGLRGREGFVALLSAWSELAQTLYDAVPFPKASICDAHRDRAEAFARMVELISDTPAPA